MDSWAIAMVKKGRPTKHVLSFEQIIWDNYNPYYQPKEASDKELLTRKEQVALERLQKAYTQLADLAGIEVSPGMITHISKRNLKRV